MTLALHDELHRHVVIHLDADVRTDSSALAQPLDSEGKVKAPPAKRQPWEQRAA